MDSFQSLVIDLFYIDHSGMQPERLGAGADTEAAAGALLKVELNGNQAGFRIDLRTLLDASESAGFDTAAAPFAELGKKERLWLDPEFRDSRFHTCPRQVLPVEAITPAPGQTGTTVG
jgi:hypothetical protein